MPRPRFYPGTSLPEQARWELAKLVRMIRIARRRGERKVCNQLLSHAHRIRQFIKDRKYSQAVHAARFRMMG
jgi:hypothetical protein